MAFFSMILAFLFIIIIILGFMLLVGGILLIVGLVTRKKALVRGKKYPLVLITIGAATVSIPCFLVGSIVVSSVVSNIRLEMERKNYNNCIDKWKNEWVTSETVKEDIMTELLAAAEAGDKAAVMALYSEEMRSKPELEEQIEVFLKDYPKGLYWEPGTGTSGSGGSSDHGMSVETTSVSCMVYKGEERYYVSFGACYENDYDASKIGLKYFHLNSEKAEVLEDDDSFEGYPEDEYIMARVNVLGDFETRLVWGYPYKFYPIERTITEAQALEAVRKAENLSELKKLLGEPNADKENMNDLVYELVSENGEPRYMVVSYDDRSGRIYLNGTYFTGTKQENARWLNQHGQFMD
ncbi:MAG: DUF5104 domain-containing protein [Lachnospira sp.]|nr:DUF5104 domain-containing protein [Lachnospira sp.]